MERDQERPPEGSGAEPSLDPEDDGWYFDLPGGAWERQEEKNRQLREQVHRNISREGGRFQVPPPSPGEQDERHGRFGRSRKENETPGGTFRLERSATFDDLRTPVGDFGLPASDEPPVDAVPGLPEEIEAAQDDSREWSTEPPLAPSPPVTQPLRRHLAGGEPGASERASLDLGADPAPWERPAKPARPAPEPPPRRSRWDEAFSGPVESGSIVDAMREWAKKAEAAPAGDDPPAPANAPGLAEAEDPSPRPSNPRSHFRWTRFSPEAAPATGPVADQPTPAVPLAAGMNEPEESTAFIAEPGTFTEEPGSAHVPEPFADEPEFSAVQTVDRPTLEFSEPAATVAAAPPEPPAAEEPAFQARPRKRGFLARLFGRDESAPVPDYAAGPTGEWVPPGSTAGGAGVSELEFAPAYAETEAREAGFEPAFADADAVELEFAPAFGDAEAAEAEFAPASGDTEATEAEFAPASGDTEATEAEFAASADADAAELEFAPAFGDAEEAAAEFAPAYAEAEEAAAEFAPAHAEADAAGPVAALPPAGATPAATPGPLWLDEPEPEDEDSLPAAPPFPAAGEAPGEVSTSAWRHFAAAAAEAPAAAAAPAAFAPSDPLDVSPDDETPPTWPSAGAALDSEPEEPIPPVWAETPAVAAAPATFTESDPLDVSPDEKMPPAWPPAASTLAAEPEEATPPAWSEPEAEAPMDEGTAPGWLFAAEEAMPAQKAPAARSEPEAEAPMDEGAAPGWLFAAEEAMTAQKAPAAWSEPGAEAPVDERAAPDWFLAAEEAMPEQEAPAAWSEPEAQAGVSPAWNGASEEPEDDSTEAASVPAVAAGEQEAAAASAWDPEPYAELSEVAAPPAAPDPWNDFLQARPQPSPAAPTAELADAEARPAEQEPAASEDDPWHALYRATIAGQVVPESATRTPEPAPAAPPPAAIEHGEVSAWLESTLEGHEAPAPRVFGLRIRPESHQAGGPELAAAEPGSGEDSSADEDVVLHAFEAHAATQLDTDDDEEELAEWEDEPAAATPAHFTEILGDDGDELVAEASNSEFEERPHLRMEGWAPQRSSVATASGIPTYRPERRPTDDSPFEDEHGMVWAPEPVVSVGPTRRSRMRTVVREVVETGLLAVLVFLAVRASFQNFKVDGNSMYPTLEDGEFLIVNKLVYSEVDMERLSQFLPFLDPGERPKRNVFHAPERGEIVVFQDPRDPGTDLIKRVVGLPGETVEIVNGQVMINGIRLDEPYIKREWHDSRPKVLVGTDEYYVMGDNRENSLDSRSIGLIHKDLIIGKALVTYWPRNKIGLAPNEAGSLGGAASPAAPAGD